MSAKKKIPHEVTAARIVKYHAEVDVSKEQDPKLLAWGLLFRDAITRALRKAARDAKAVR